MYYERFRFVERLSCALEMKNIMSKCVALRGICRPSTIASYQTLFQRNYTEEAPYSLDKERIIHPYKKIHPWKSLDKFTEYLLKNVVYNEDGLVVLNKPYGISVSAPTVKREGTTKHLHYKIPNQVSYTISDSLPEIAKQLGYEKLIPVKRPERYMSGAIVLAADTRIETAITKSYAYAQSISILPKTYWIVTTMIPIELKGKVHLAMKLVKNNSNEQKKAIITAKWSNNEKKRRDVKMLNVEFKVLSNSTLNLSSLIEMKASTVKWHAVRLFAATKLYSPVLGDNYYGSRIQKIKNTHLIVDPFSPATELLPTLNKELLSLLHLIPSRQELIPVHIHLRSVFLPSLFGRNKDFKIEVPLLPPFDWTCEQLKFKLPRENENETNTEDLQVALTSS